MHSSPREFHPHLLLTPSKFRQKLIEGEARRSASVCVYADELSLRLCSDNYCIPPQYGLTVINCFNSSFGVMKERVV